MSNSYIALLLGAIVLIIMGITIVIKKPEIVNEKESLIEIENKKINETYEKLVQCESLGNKLAINTRDSDGTASFGLLQWKPETFRMLAVKYGIIGEKADWNWIMTIIWDERINKKLFFEILKDKDVNPKLLWPTCWRKINK